MQKRDYSLDLFKMDIIRPFTPDFTVVTGSFQLHRYCLCLALRQCVTFSELSRISVLKSL